MLVQCKLYDHVFDVFGVENEDIEEVFPNPDDGKSLDIRRC